jgi:hypothetical protein
MVWQPESGRAENERSLDGAEAAWERQQERQSNQRQERYGG